MQHLCYNGHHRIAKSPQKLKALLSQAGMCKTCTLQCSVPPKKTPPKDTSGEGKSSIDKDAEPSLKQQMKDATRDAQLKVLQEQRGKPC